jgi:NitT/TauT family transport system substrate-binding protein
MAAAACGNSGSTDQRTSDAQTTSGSSSSATTGTAPSTDAGSEKPADDTRTKPLSVTFGWFPAFHTAAPMIADIKGFWKDLNLTVEMVAGESGAQLANLLSTGKMDYSYGSIESAARGRAEGRDVIQVAPLGSQGTLNTVVRNGILEELGVSVDDPIEKKLEAFSKMKIGITAPNAPTDSYARMYMKMAGVDPDTEGTLVTVGGASTMNAALKSGAIDAYMLTPPTPNVPEIEGFGTIFIRGTTGEIPELANMPDTGLGVRESWLADPDNEEATIRMIQGMLMAIEYIHSDFDQAVADLQKYFPEMDPKVVRVGLEEMLPALPVDLNLSEEMVSHSLDVLFKYGLLKLDEKPSSEIGGLWTNKYLNAAKERLAG